MQHMILNNNYGNKLNNPEFVHIAPVSNKTLQELYQLQYIITTKNNTHPKNNHFKIKAATVLPLIELTASLTLHSHNMQRFEFYVDYFNNNPHLSFNLELTCCIYFFVRF